MLCLSELFVAMCERFPHSLSPDMLFAHCCWEHVVHWNRDPEVHLTESRAVPEDNTVLLATQLLLQCYYNEAVTVLRVSRR